MSHSTSFGKTLAFVTRVKLQELEKRRTAFATHSSKVIEEAKKHEGNLEQQVTILVEGIKSWPGTWSSSGNFSLANIENGLAQAQKDPAFPHPLLIQWHDQIRLRFSRESTQFEYARLFGSLLSEWLVSRETALVNPAENDLDIFEKVNRKETMEQQDKLESIIFEERKIDSRKFQSYLDGIFGTKEAKDALKTLRESMTKCGEEIQKSILTLDDVKQCTKSLLSSDLLSEEKQETLREFLQNEVVMTELVSVLNMQIPSLSKWSWPESGVMVEPRRHLNGKIRFFLDYEILTAMLLHYVGMKWSTGLKAALRDFHHSYAWRQRVKPISPLSDAKYDVFMGPSSFSASIDAQRANFQRDKVFMCQLPSSMDATDNYSDDPSSSEDYGLFGTDLKQELLHFMSADILVNEAFHGECTVVKTDIEWFGPSLSHQAVLVVLEYLGMPEQDRRFVKAFLACPLLFQNTVQSSMDSGVRVRVRGLPISHALTTFCAEAVLFLVDFAVNQRADGLFLYRIHDDFWFWDNDPDRCVSAWQEILRVLDLLGLKLNQGKTGSVHVGKKGSLHSTLPTGDIRWGFLRMDPERDGRFIIEQEMVDEHIKELKRQLDATNSVFAWVRAYNKYMDFFSRNFGTPINVYGRKHVDNIIETFARIQRDLFTENGGSILRKVSLMIAQKFNTTDIPSGWFFWPMESGGLQIKDPMILPFTMREKLPESRIKLLEDAVKSEELAYISAKRDWESGKRPYYTGTKNTSLVSSSSTFFDYDEFTTYRGPRSLSWGRAFTNMLAPPEQLHMEKTPGIQAEMQVLGTGTKAFGAKTGNSWEELSAYWKWIISLHHEEMSYKFGGLAIVEPSSIPVGMLGVFNSSRTRWEQ